ncbi:MAG TPA: SpoIIE family protein phosphatase [Candidatus Merdenecus merdavium]|nr:SpoIIE family protein phosphatase [Candidatus Merdenecus merdavium]
MNEVIIAVLILVVILIFWDLGKRLLRLRKEEPVSVIVGDPGRDRIVKYADSFKNLAGTFSNLPYRKEHLNSQDLEEIFGSVSDKLCSKCQHQDYCWNKNYFETYKTVYDILNVVEESGEDISLEIQDQFAQKCIQSQNFLKEMIHSFNRAKLNLMWSNKLLESRVAVAEQLSEMADIMTSVADNIYDVSELNEALEAELKSKLNMLSIRVNRISVLENKAKKQEVYLTMRAAKGKCIPTKEIAGLLSKVLDKRMAVSRESRSIVNQEYSTTLFVEDTYFQVLTGVAKVTKEGETVSGDNFAFINKEDGQMVMSMSDGMGSGLHACKESEMVIELLEQFLEAGFEQETAVKLINSAMVISSEQKSFSTIDLCTIDLYNGVCEFLKIGASTTFIKRDHWVETITSTSLPAGVFQQVDYDSTSKKLYDGDFLIMVSDGVLDALPPEKSEEILKEMIMLIKTTNSKEFAKALLERVLVYHHCRVTDDMTVLVGGLWKK